MKLATVDFRYGDKPETATLTDRGWSLTGDAAGLAGALDRLASTADYGPEDGDPVARAARQAARILDGTVRFICEPEPAPPGTVY